MRPLETKRVILASHSETDEEDFVQTGLTGFSLKMDHSADRYILTASRASIMALLNSAVPSWSRLSRDVRTINSR